MSLEAAFGGLSSKLLIACSGLAGGISIGTFYVPKKIAERGIIIISAIVMSVPIFMSLAFTEIIMQYLGVGENNSVPVAFIVGACSLFLVNILSNYAKKFDDATITEVLDDIKD